MTNRELRQAVEFAKTEIRNALQTVYDSINHGQQTQIVKDEAVKALYERYGVVIK